ncbi:MAG: hypothetical protein JWN76_296, partial [Chitinophagaceae bacterium]|nr:hypothetical protein [Chitinophagaceae bacterium]
NTFYHMDYRQFGNTSLQVSEIGFGAWAIGGGAMIGNTAIGWGKADDTQSANALFKALDAGINFFDTADIYGLGHSEILLGKFLKGKDVIIATKAGNVARDNRFTTDYSKQHIINACNESLKRLQRDVIDYYQLHSARVEHLQQGECIETMEQLQKEGKIRYWGLSLNTFNPLPEAEFLLEKNSGSGFQLVLNLINQRALPLLKSCKEKGYGIIARMPLQFGLLTGKFDDGAFFEVDDHRHNRLTEDIIIKSKNALQDIWQLCEKYDCTKTQLALSYILSYDPISTVITGVRTEEQVKANTTGLLKLDSEDILLIEECGTNNLPELMKLIEQKG